MTVLDPFEGLPAHMLESIPLTVEVTIEQPAGPRCVTVQLERDGRPLTVGDRLPGWVPGEREGWREWPGPKAPPELTDTWYTIDNCEEEHAGD